MRMVMDDKMVQAIKGTVNGKNVFFGMFGSTPCPIREFCWASTSSRGATVIVAKCRHLGEVALGGQAVECNYKAGD